MSMVGDSFKQGITMVLSVVFAVTFIVLIALVLFLFVFPRIPWDALIKKILGI